jgi:hypothetical protein
MLFQAMAHSPPKQLSCDFARSAFLLQGSQEQLLIVNFVPKAADPSAQAIALHGLAGRQPTVVMAKPLLQLHYYYYYYYYYYHYYYYYYYSYITTILGKTAMDGTGQDSLSGIFLPFSQLTRQLFREVVGETGVPWFGTLPKVCLFYGSVHFMLPLFTDSHCHALEVLSRGFHACVHVVISSHLHPFGESC